MGKKNFKKYAVAVLAAVILVGVNSNTQAAMISLFTDGIGYIQPTQLGSAFVPAHLNNMISAYNGTAYTPVASETYYVVVGTSPAATFPNPLPYPENNAWYNSDPGGDSVHFTKGTLGINSMSLPVNAATATINLGAGGISYLVGQWDGPNGGNVIYYVGGLTGEITLVNDLGKYIPMDQWQGNEKKQDPSTYALSHFYAVPESTTVVAGALLLLPFAVSTVRFFRNRKA